MVSSKSGINENDIRERLKKIEQDLKYEKEEIKEVKETSSIVYKKDYIERKLLGIILWQKILLNSGRGTPEKEPRIDIEKILKELADILGIPALELLEKTKDSEGDLIFEAEVFYGEGADILKDIEEMLSNLKEEYLKEELESKMRELHNAEEIKDTELSSKILKECQVLNSKIQNIKNGRLSLGRESALGAENY
jgi:hypothetical protein